jgi:hypothetical protein
MGKAAKDAKNFCEDSGYSLLVPRLSLKDLRFKERLKVKDE